MRQLFDFLAQYGGTIESTGTMDEMNIKQAQASGRIWVDENSLGYVWMPIPKFPETVEEVELFEKWFPLKVELPEELRTFDGLMKRKRNQSGIYPTPEGMSEEIKQRIKFEANRRFAHSDTNGDEIDSILVRMFPDAAGFGYSLALKEIARLKDDVMAERERAGKLMEALGLAKQYFDDRADCDHQGDPLEPIPNYEMIMLSEIQTAINEYKNKP